MSEYLCRVIRYVGGGSLSKLERILDYITKKLDPFWMFTSADALAINKARLEHLASLELDLAKKSVLEVGAGIGLLTEFFEGLGCSILSTDARPENLAQSATRFPHRRIQVLDLDFESDLSSLGSFDMIFAYGTLYHLSRPEQALASLSSVCREMILLETMVSPGSGVEISSVEEPGSKSQAMSGTGSRPTRRWVMEMLREHFGYAYVTKTQPRHEDFDLCWVLGPYTKRNHWAVFVGSKVPLENPFLSEDVPDHQTYWG